MFEKAAFIVLFAIFWIILTIVGSAFAWWFGRLCARLLGME
jgi:hypothetical protein